MIRPTRAALGRFAWALAAVGALATSSASAATVYWATGNGNWDIGTVNWVDGVSAPTAYADGNDAVFNTAANATITISAGIAPASTEANPSSGTLQFSGGPLAGAGGLTKKGAGTLQLNAANSYTGKTSIQAGQVWIGNSSPGYLSNAGVAGALGAPTGPNSVIDMYNGSILRVGTSSPRTIQSTDRTLNLADPAGAGTVTLRFNDNDTLFTLGAVTATGNGAKLLDIYTGYGGNGDRQSVTINGPISDVTGDASKLSLRVTFATQSANTSYVNLPGVNTFTGDITLVKGNAVLTSYLTVGGLFYNAFGGTGGSANTPGTGSLGSGNYPGNISLGATTNFNYLSSASQTLSGVISGVGNVIVGGGGTVTLSGLNTYSSNTTVKSGSSLVLADGGGMTFYVTNSSSNKITGAGTATLDGDFTIDTSAVTLATGSWTLVDTTTKSFTSNFSVVSPGWSETSNVWTRVDGPYTWTFKESDGMLSVSGPALFTSFGIPGYPGAIDNDLATVKLVVPKGTDFATLAPTFTLSSGTCDQTSGAVPSPSFGTANPVTYTVTDTATDPDTVRSYVVTVLEATGIINVSAEKAGEASSSSLLTGPAGGLGETWNQVTVNNASGLLDSVGVPTTVSFTVNTDGLDKWNTGSLQMLWSGLRNFGKGTANQMVISGLTSGDLYNVYIASTQGNGEAGKGDWSTSNTTSSVGAQSVDSSVSLNTTTWVQGNNYALLENVVVDTNGKITLNGQAAAGFRLPVNGFQLVPSGAATITSFGIPGADGVIDQDAKTIALKVPYGTDLATLAPVFTLTSGTCNQTSGAAPSPTFAASNPVTYTVTDTGTDPDTVNNYIVTVTVSAQTTTLVINLGAGTVIEGGTFGSHGTNLPLPSLPAGSILRSIAIDAVLEATDNDNFASDLSVLLDPTPGAPGGDFSVEITNGTSPLGGGALHLGWPVVADAPPIAPLTDTKTESDWAAVGTIDLNSTGLFLGNAYGGPVLGGTWSGTITLTYDVVGGVPDYTTWAAGYLPDDVLDPALDFDGDGMTNREEHAFGLNPTSGSSVNPITVPLDAGAGTLSYTRRSTSGLTYTIWTSTDLDVWTKDTAASASQSPGTPDGNGVETVAVTLTAAPVDGKLFVQVRAN